MSFACQVRDALCCVWNKPCCERAELYGFLLFSPVFSLSEIRIATSNERILRRYIRCLEYFHIDCRDVRVGGIASQTYHLSFVPSESMKDAFGVNFFSLQDGAAPSFLSTDCCRRAFLRGAFLACGTVSDPARSYHLEWTTSAPVAAQYLVSVVSDFDIPAKIRQRRDKNIVYLKTSDHIKDLLSLIGAKDLMFDYANVEIVKNIRNSVNRATNCEVANIEKTVSASESQIRAIEKLIAAGYSFENPQLDEIAQLRLRYPAETLTFLGSLCVPPLSKAGVAHRLKKIMEIAKE